MPLAEYIANNYELSHRTKLQQNYTMGIFLQ